MNFFDQTKYNSMSEEWGAVRHENELLRDKIKQAGLFIAAAAKCGYISKNQKEAILTALHYLTGEDPTVLEVVVQTILPKRV